MERRDLLKTGGLAAVGIVAGGCSARVTRSTPQTPYVNLPLVEASWDRVIRTTVGLRPHRPSGFHLRTEKLDAKTVIHNYGHGGAGHSLGWGTGAMAAEMALAEEDRRAAIIGCGTIGLTAARQLQRRGFDVTIYAKSVPPDTTSNKALAGFTPTSGLVDTRLRSPEWSTQFSRAAEISYEELQLLVGRGYGVSWINTYRFMEEFPRPQQSAGFAPTLRPRSTRVGDTVLQPEEHPFPSRYATRAPWLRIEPAIYLDRLMRDVIHFGGRIVIRGFATKQDLAILSESLIINCTGLGARELFNDDKLIAVKGQLTMLVPQREVNYGTFGGIPGSERGGFYHMIPRSDGIALGGTSQHDDWSLEPDEDARRRIVGAHLQLFNGMRAPNPRARLSATGPDRTLPLENFFGLES
ncbi:MAG: FAD-dependent oxidoreductase [Acidobacteriota bacterium]|nr:FAD-dependent oxidoreductase [Acidobacteriota bacterium]